MQSIYSALEHIQDNIYANQLRRGFRNLRFDTPLEQEYLHYQHKAHARYQRMGSLLALAIWLFFALLDWLRVYLKQHVTGDVPELWAMLAIRGTIALTLVILVVLLYQPRRENYSATVVATTLLSLVLGSTLMIVLYQRLAIDASYSVLLIMAIQSTGVAPRRRQFT